MILQTKVRWTSLFTVLIAFLVIPGICLGGTYRDKHGNQGNITLSSPVINSTTGGIDYSVPYTLTDSEGAKSGEYLITSDMLPGRDAGSDDFVLSVLVTDDATMKGAELIFRNNANVAPLAPIVRFLDCSTDPCTEDKVNNNEQWGCFVIEDQADLAYPVELLDARVITQLLDSSQLSMLPNMDDGTGNWGDIMEYHRTNFEESRFRMDVDHLGETQSDLLTTRMIAELDAPTPGSPDDWLVRHFPSITHGALTFLTGHRALIEDMTTELFNNYNWPTDYTFPFGRMPVWLVDPHLDADPGTPHILPTHWERVMTSLTGLGIPGCWHDFPTDAYVPTLGNGNTNLGQYECDQIATPDGFLDRPCTQESDYSDPGTGGTSLLGDVEGAYHNPIHGFIGGDFGPPSTTAGCMVFWIFHTHVSTNLLANWRHAQKRSMPEPMVNQPPDCDAGDPYMAECQGTTTDVDLDGSGSSDPDGDSITFSWVTDCDGGFFDDSTSPTPTLTLNSPQASCTVTLTVTDEHGASSECATTVSVVDTTPPDISVALDPEVLWPPNHKLADISATVDVTDICDPNPEFTLVAILSNEPDDDGGDGNTQNDIQEADIGTADTAFLLRAERSGRGDGRKYTVIYEAEDASGNTASDTACVFVPHDQDGLAFTVSGFTEDGLHFRTDIGESGYGRDFGVAIRNLDRNSSLDPSRALVGNLDGKLEPTNYRWVDVDGDGARDLLLRYEMGPALQLLYEDMTSGKSDDKIEVQKKPQTLAIRYETTSGSAYLVADIFALGEPIEIPGEDNGEDLPDVKQVPESDGALTGNVVVEVYTVTGRKVRTFTHSGASSDLTGTSWDGRDSTGRRLPNGIYFYRVLSEHHTMTKKIVLAR